jgi:hypothetical protein
MWLSQSQAGENARMVTGKSVAGKSLFLIVVAGGLLAGCAASRSELDVSVARPSVTPTKAAVKITEVADKRHFEADPRSPTTPSVRDGEIDNKALIARAVGRKRGGFGNAWGDVVLPEGKTVSGLIADVLSAALAEKGYAVVAKGSPQYDSALPLSAEVLKFWSWFSPGFLTISVTNESLVRLTGPWPVADADREVSGQARVESHTAIVEDDWAEVLKKGTEDLKMKVEGVLK